MLPEKFKSWDKIIVTVPIQDSLYKSWESRAVETVKDFPLRKGVIICKDAIGNPRKKSDDLYLAFSFNDDFIRLEEVHGTYNKTTALWDVPYEGHVENGLRLYNIKYELKYGVQRKRMQLLTSTFFGVIEYVAQNRGNEALIVRSSENVKVVKTPKKGAPVVSYVDCETFDIKNVTPIEGKPAVDQSGAIVWLKVVEG